MTPQQMPMPFQQPQPQLQQPYIQQPGYAQPQPPAMAGYLPQMPAPQQMPGQMPAMQPPMQQQPMIQMPQLTPMSLEVEDFVVGGLINDVDAEITEIMWCGFDYNGAVTDGDVLAVRINFTGLDPNGNLDPSMPIPEQYWSAGGKFAEVVVSGDGYFVMPRPDGGKAALTQNSHFHILLQSMRTCGMPPGFMRQYNNSLQCLKGIRAHWIRMPVGQRSGLTITRRRGQQQAEEVLCINRYLRAPFPLTQQQQQRRQAKTVAVPAGAPMQQPMQQQLPMQPMQPMQQPPPMQQQPPQQFAPPQAPQAPQMQPPQMQPQMPPQIPQQQQPMQPPMMAPPAANGPVPGAMPQAMPLQQPMQQQAPPQPQAAPAAAPVVVDNYTPTGNPAQDAVTAVSDLLAKAGGSMSLNDVKVNVFRGFQRAESTYRNQVVALVQDPNWLGQCGYLINGDVVSLPQQQQA